MDYIEITEAYGNLIRAIKKAGMTVGVSRMRVKEDRDREVFIKIKARRSKDYVLKE